MQSPDLSRRAFLRGKRPAIYREAIFPPWSLPGESFIATCTRCDACINACPESILYKGDSGFPEVDFKRGACTFCRECIASCQADAFHAAAAANKNFYNAWNFVASVSSDCLSLQGITCRTCAEYCATRAIRFQLQLGGKALPVVSQAACTGCGACVKPCPVNALIVQHAGVD